jgi:hypothetical protein
MAGWTEWSARLRFNDTKLDQRAEVLASKFDG